MLRRPVAHHRKVFPLRLHVPCFYGQGLVLGYILPLKVLLQEPPRFRFGGDKICMTAFIFSGPVSSNAPIGRSFVASPPSPPHSIDDRNVLLKLSSLLLTPFP